MLWIAMTLLLSHQKLNASFNSVGKDLEEEFSTKAYLNVTHVVDHAEFFYRIALSRSCSNSSKILPQVHLMRIPKASSSSLSAVARRIVGCEPPGPCCFW
jgi:hypothetical protein